VYLKGPYANSDWRRSRQQSDHCRTVDVAWIRLRFFHEAFAISIEEGLDGQDSSVTFREPSRRPVNRDGKLNMRNAGEIRTQPEHRCCGSEVPAELTTVAVTGSHVGTLCTA